MNRLRAGTLLLFTAGWLLAALPVRAEPRLQNHPGERALQKLSRMTPEEREKALANLPPQRRQMIMRRLQNFQTMPPASRDRAIADLERLHSLPPQRQNQVRRSLLQLQMLPEERKTLIGQEMERLNGMPEEERRARMNTEEFRNRYSPAEQQMMSNLAELSPRD